MTVFESAYPFLHAGYPVGGALFYALTLFVFWPKVDHPRGKYRVSKTILKPIMLLHNLVLLVFSLTVFLKTYPRLLEGIQTGDPNYFFTKLYSGHDYEHFSFWSWCFYMSKFYEFIDTWIILAKGGRPITLQIFHHMGAVITMWALVVTKAPCSWIFVVLNSLIHSIMYTYYTLSIFKIRIPFKSIVTQLQILQFVVGLTISVLYMSTEGALNPFQTAALSFTQCYVSVVLHMFCQFAFTEYVVKPRMSKGSSTASAKSHEA